MITQVLPAARAEAMCGKAIDAHFAALEETKLVADRELLFQGLVLLVMRLPSERGAEAVLKAMEMAASTGQRRRMAVGLAEIARGLKPRRAKAVCGKLADALLVMIARAASPSEREWLTVPLASACRFLPADRAWGLLGVLENANGPISRATLSRGLIVIADNISHKNSGLPHDLAALVGGSSLRPTTPSEPYPTAAQQLVELLKHPFCVREARRAVLDALEFTYDRRFADLWEFVAFAEKNTTLDLLTPPKRPTK